MSTWSVDYDLRRVLVERGIDIIGGVGYLGLLGGTEL